MNMRSVLNFRDIGGILTIGNKKIRNGVIFRSANLDNISNGDINKFYLLNIRTIIDLRALHERKKLSKPIDNTDHLSIPLDFKQVMQEKLKPLLHKRNSEGMIAEISNSLYLDILDAVAPLFKQIMEVLVSPDRCPVLIHCQAGKDRTGIICALILLALGTERHLIIEDFLKSNDSLLPYFKKMLLIRKILSFGFFPSRRVLFAITVRQRYIESVLDRIDDHYGGIEAYLNYSGFDASGLPELRRNLCIE
jgi:protein-tyrosine phosphatase